MSDTRCKICLGSLGEKESSYHPACCRKLFDASQPPQLPFTWADLNALAEKVVRSHVAVPGVQPKLSLHLERGSARDSGRFTLVGLEGGFILKPPVERFPEMPQLELLTMRMARCFGIDTAVCGLVELEDGLPALIVRRMDRLGTAKLPMEDMCQLTDRLTAEKYRGSLETVGKAIWKHCTNPGLDALRFFEVNLFCFLTGNADMHLKNFSLIGSIRGEIRLSPAYDLLATALLLPGDTEETALTLNGKKRRIRLEDFRSFGTALKLTERQVDNALRRFEKGIGTATRMIDHAFCSDEGKARYRKLMSDRTQRLGLSQSGYRCPQARAARGAGGSGQAPPGMAPQAQAQPWAGRPRADRTGLLHHGSHDLGVGDRPNAAQPPESASGKTGASAADMRETEGCAAPRTPPLSETAARVAQTARPESSRCLQGIGRLHRSRQDFPMGERQETAAP